MERALADAGVRVVNLGRIPTPALMYYALAHGCASIHVPPALTPAGRK